MADIDTPPPARAGAASKAPRPVGARLMAAREAAGLSLADLSESTRIPTRMLMLIEAGDFAALPARIYATGFTRSYARALGLNETEYVAAVRAELGISGHSQDSSLDADFEPGDPARVPSAKLAWLAALAAVAVLVGVLVFWRTYYAPAVALPSILPDEQATAEVSPSIELETGPVPTDPASLAPAPAAGLVPAAAALPAVQGALQPVAQVGPAPAVQAAVQPVSQPVAHPAGRSQARHWPTGAHHHRQPRLGGILPPGIAPAPAPSTVAN